MEENEAKTLKFEKIFIFIIALIGFLTTIELALIYFNSNFNRYAMPSFCSINSFVDCDGVARTVHSQFFGIPLAYWGMFFYVFIFFLLIVDKLKNIKFLGFLKLFKNPMAYISALGLTAFFISMILACVSLFEIKKVCILCVFTYILNLVISIVATDFKAGIISSFKISIQDFISAIKEKQYLASFLALAIVGCGVLYYTTTSYIFTPQVRIFDSFNKYITMKTNPYAVKGNVLGDKDAKLTVYIYTDYRCPICKVYNIITHRAAKELSGFKIVHKNLPLDMTCNPNLKTPFHQGSCMLAKYAVAAGDQGHFWDMNTALFDKQPKTEQDVIEIAKSLGLNTEKLQKDANSKETAKAISDDLKDAAKLNIQGTPCIVINGQLYIGLKPYNDLVDILKKAGAVDRK